MDIVFASDFFITDFVGGAALNDEELCSLLSQRHNNIIKIKTENITIDFIEQNKAKKWLISNFFKLTEECKNKIQECVDYCIIAHDYKFVEHTNPAIYPNFIVPRNEIINETFLSKARNVFCQSNLQQEIHRRNITNIKTVNLSGNLWSTKAIEFMSDLRKRKKNPSFAVVKSPFPQKGVPESIAVLINNKLDYDLVSDQNYYAFLNKLSVHAGLCFIPKTPETLSRVVCEAKACGMNVITNNYVGATAEPWYNEKDFIRVLIDMRNRIPTIIEDGFNV